MNIGIIALGSHEENHGAALPPDTDAQIAEYIAEKTAAQTNAEFLGVLKSAYEFPEINTGNHDSLDQVIADLKTQLRKAEKQGFEGILLINAHGGNQELSDHLEDIARETNLEIKMDSTVCKIEGPHAGTGELSIGSVLGITDETKITDHLNSEKYPEVGFVGFDKAREKYEWAEEHANEIIENGVKIDPQLGEKLLKISIENSVEKIRDLKSEIQL